MNISKEIKDAFKVAGMTRVRRADGTIAKDMFDKMMSGFRGGNFNDYTVTNAYHLRNAATRDEIAEVAKQFGYWVQIRDTDHLALAGNGKIINFYLTHIGTSRSSTTVCWWILSK